jgi:hypothetical protein
MVNTITSGSSTAGGPASGPVTHGIGAAAVDGAALSAAFWDLQ